MKNKGTGKEEEEEDGIVTENNDEGIARTLLNMPFLAESE